MAIYDYQGNVIATGGSGGSPIAGKRVHFIGDSNLQYISDELKTHLEETYACTVTNSAYAGATWETTNGADTTESASGVGQVNKVIATADSSKLIPDYDCIVVMLGTNCTTEGELTDTSADVTTMCGAMKYCMEKLCYYGRQIPIGVIIPIRTDGNYSAPVELPSKFQKIEEIAKQYNVPTLNLYTAGRVIPNGMTPDGNGYYLTDSVHMGANGKLLFKQIVGKWIAYGMYGTGASGGASLASAEEVLF
jgi:hypothetical protein